MIEKYKDFLEDYTYIGEKVESYYGRQPASRYHTIKRAFELFTENQGKTIVELGTPRSFVHGGLVGCNNDDTKYWAPENPERWDWSAGLFSRVAAEYFEGTPVKIHTVDIAESHIKRSRIITSEFSEMFEYHVMSSTDFLRGFSGKIDLLYVDTGDMTPIDPTALHQLEEVKVVIEKEILPEKGIVLIDDVRNTTPLKAGDVSGLGKAKYSIPFLLSNGFRIAMDEYQVLLVKK